MFLMLGEYSFYAFHENEHGRVMSQAVTLAVQSNLGQAFIYYVQTYFVSNAYLCKGALAKEDV